VEQFAFREGTDVRLELEPGAGDRLRDHEPHILRAYELFKLVSAIDSGGGW
jgi:hypothetical protein